MQHSGPNNPCPSCGRVKGDYCRWDLDAGKILCYVGQSCGPEAGLKLGELTTIAGEQWALAMTDCGFAGNSSLFVRHDASASPGAKPRTATQLQRQTVALMLQQDAFERDAELAGMALNHVRNLPEFHFIPPAEIRQAIAMTQDAHVLFTNLLVQCRRLRRLSPDIGQVAEQLQSGLREVMYQRKDLCSFWFDQLKDPGAGRGKQLAQQLKHQQNISSPL